MGYFLFTVPIIKILTVYRTEVQILSEILIKSLSLYYDNKRLKGNTTLELFSYT